MNIEAALRDANEPEWLDLELEELAVDEESPDASGISRRTFVQLLGAGLLLTVTDRRALGQRRRFGNSGGGPATIGARLHLGRDGTITVLTGKVEVEPTPTLLVVGAGHVGVALAKLAVGLNFRVVVLDDRSDLLSPARLPAPIETVAGNVERLLRQWPVDANTYVVVVTRGHTQDERALHAVIDSPAKYLGMIGSRRKVQLLFDDLTTLGVSPARLQQVHAPIGLKLGAVAVPEIAVSIAAELIQVRRAEAFRAVEGPFEIAGGQA